MTWPFCCAPVRLPAKLTILEERTVGASLGADSIASGKVAAMIGLAASSSALS